MKYIMTIMALLFVFTGCSKTWQGLKDDSSTAWEKTKDASSKAYKDTKKAVNEATAD